jgi:hypothetical protein
MPVIPVSRVVDKVKGEKEEERRMGSLTPQKQII